MDFNLDSAVRIVTADVTSANMNEAELNNTNTDVDTSDTSDTSSVSHDTIESLLAQSNSDKDDFESEEDEEDEEDEDEDESYQISQTVEQTSHSINEQLGYGCKHYLRRCSIYAECCNKFFPCHRCHDDRQNDQSTMSIENHEIERHDVKKIKCSNCNHEQTVHQFCEKCKVCFGFYFCDKCITIDDIDKQYYHCDKCGICRVGRGIKYVHCDVCQICFNEKLQHVCIEVGDCPICFDDLKKSTVPIHKLKCGHSIHMQCFSELIKTTYKCPMCQKSITDMKDYIQNMDAHIAQNPMPAEYKNDDGTDKITKVYCNDCGKYTDTIFHFIGLKCTTEDCGGYNTKQI